MTKNESVVYVFSQSVCALIELEGMKAENKDRESRQESLAYTEDNFLELERKFCIGYNDIIKVFKDARG